MNPFRHIGPSNQATAVRRTAAQKQVVTHLRRGEYVSVLAPRQTGKTTFLDVDLGALCESYSVCRLNLEDAKPDQLLRRFQKTCDPASAPPEGSSPDQPARLSRLNNWLSRDTGEAKKTVFLVDELPRDLGAATVLLTEIRAHFNEARSQDWPPRVLFVFTGSDDLDMLANRDAPIGSVFNIAHEVYLEDFTKEETAKLIQQLTASDDRAVAFDTTTIDKIFHFTLGHPYLVQLLCSWIYDNPDRRDEALASPEAAVTLCRIQESTNAQAMMNRLTLDEGLAKERALLEDLVLGGRPIKFTPTVRSHRVLQLPGCIRGSGEVRNPIYEVIFRRHFEAERPSSPFAMEIRPFSGYMHIQLSEAGCDVPPEETPTGPVFNLNWGRCYHLASALVEGELPGSAAALTPPPSMSIPINIPGTGRRDRAVRYHLRPESFCVDITPAEESVSILSHAHALPEPSYCYFRFYSPAIPGPEGSPDTDGPRVPPPDDPDDPDEHGFCIHLRVLQAPAIVQVCELRFRLPGARA